MTSKKEGYTKICCDIPIAWHEAIKEYNEGASLQINMSNVMRMAIKECVEKIANKEM